MKEVREGNIKLKVWDEGDITVEKVYNQDNEWVSKKIKLYRNELLNLQACIEKLRILEVIENKSSVESEERKSINIDN